MEVTEDVYKEFKRSYWREHKNNQKHRYYEILFSTLTVEEPDTDACEFYEEFESNEIPPDVLVSMDDECQRLLSCVSEIVRRRIILHFSYGYSYGMIASLEHVSINSVKTSIIKGIKKIKNFSG